MDTKLEVVPSPTFHNTRVGDVLQRDNVKISVPPESIKMMSDGLNRVKNLKISFSKAKVKFYNRQKIVNGIKVSKMNITVKLNKEETQGYSSFIKSLKPKEQNEADFAKMIFFLGIKAVQDEVNTAVLKFKEENPEEYEKMINAVKAESEPEVTTDTNNETNSSN